MQPDILPSDLDGDGLRIGIVRARFNEDIGQQSLDACLRRLAELSVSADDITVASVPGALELGVTLAHMANSGDYDALIALGAVVRGDTYHFEVVSNESARAISQVSLSTGVPIANGVLTTDTDEQAQSRAAVKGAECAACAVEMANLVATLEEGDEDFDEEDDDFDEDDLDDDD